MPRSRPDAPNAVDVRVRVVALLLEPALALAHAMALPLDDLARLVEEGYFREARGRGLSLRGIARRWDASLHTVARLAKATSSPAARSGTERLGAQRRAVLAIAAHPGASRGELARALRTISAADLDDAIAALAEQGVVEVRDGRHAIAAQHLALLGPGLDERLDSLRHLLGAVGEAVRVRFFSPSAGAIALARVLSFSSAPDTLRSLANDGYADLRARVLAADGAAGEDAVPAHAVFVAVERPRATAPER